MKKFLLLFIAGLLMFSAQMVKKRERRKDARINIPKVLSHKEYSLSIFRRGIFLGGEILFQTSPRR